MKDHRMVLTRRPKPKNNESRNGYYLRLSEANGFGSPWHLLKRAEMEQHEWRTRGDKTQKIAAITGLPTKELDGLGYRVDGSFRAYQLLGNPLRAVDLDLQNPRLCLECIRDLKFIEAHWDLTFMIGCPVHNRWATFICAACGGKLRRYRAGLVRCQCGAELRNCDETTLDVPLRSLLEILRAGVLGWLPFAEFGANLPILELHRLPLCTLLKVVRIVGMSALIASDQELESEPKAIICFAAQTFADWPTNFHAMLHKLAKPPSQKGDIRQEFAPLYSAIFRNSIEVNPGDLDFIKAAFLDFVSNQWNARKMDSRILRGVRTLVTQKYLNTSQLAQRLQVDPRTIRRHERMQLIRFPEGPNATFEVAPEMLQVAESGDSKLMSLRRAAGVIGIPSTVLRLLKEKGYIKFNYQLARQVGFPERDVLAFRDGLILLGAECQVEEDTEGEILGQVLRSSSLSAGDKAHLLHQIAERDIRIVGALDNTVKGLTISAADFCIFRRSRRSDAGGIALTCTEAAAILKCEFEAVADLIRQGKLTGTRSKTQWLVSESSVVEFAAEYMPMASLASAVGSTSRHIAMLCGQQGIEIVAAGRRPTAVRLFVRRCDGQRIAAI